MSSCTCRCYDGELPLPSRSGADVGLPRRAAAAAARTAAYIAAGAVSFVIVTWLTSH